MNTVSMVGSVSRRAGGLFESVRRLHQELLTTTDACASKRLDSARSRATTFNVSVLGLKDECTDSDLPAWAPVPVYTFAVRGPRCFGYAPGLANRLRALNPEIVHVHGLWQYNSFAAVVWHRQSRRPCIVSPHGMLDPWAMEHGAWKKRLAWRAYERRHLEAAACIRALCQPEADSIRALGLRNPICIVPNGVDLPDQPQEAGESATFEKSGAQAAAVARGETDPDGLSSGPGVGSDGGDCGAFFTNPKLAGRKVLLYLGRLHPKKGLQNLLKAWAKVRPPDERLLVIAGWDQAGHEAELKALAGELGIHWAPAGSEPGLAETVWFAGPQFDAAKLNALRRCDAFILPSFSEGLPMAVLEAWAHAKPVLMTPECHLPEGFAAGAAILIEPSAAGIAAGLNQLFEASASNLDHLGACGRRLVAARFAWPQIAGDLKSVYQWILGAGPRPDCVCAP